MRFRPVLLAGVAFLAIAAAAPAYAGSSVYGVEVVQGHGAHACPRGQLCLYRDYNLNDNNDAPILRTDHSIPWLGRYGFNDTTSSVCNRTFRFAVIYQDARYEGRQVWVRPHKCANVPADFNDQASSVRLL